VLGTTGAAAANDQNEVGSPGTIGRPPQIVVTPPPSVKINEIDSSSSGSDWIELTNTGTSVVDLAGLKLLDSDNAHTKYSIPAGTSLAPARSWSSTRHSSHARLHDRKRPNHLPLRIHSAVAISPRW
jgi:hypothetical protein